MDELLFVDSTFEKDNTSRYELSIQLCLDGFSFSILCSKNKCLALFQSKRITSENENNSIEALKNSVRNCEYLNLSYAKVSVLWLTKKASLIPSEFFSEDLAIDSFQLCHPLLKDEIIRWDELKVMNSYLVYSIPSALPEFIESQFAGAKISHQNIHFYQRALKELIDIKHPKVYIQIYDNFFDAFIPGNNQKHVANSFSYKEETDMVYYILNIYKQLKLNTAYSQLFLSGKIDHVSKSYQILKRYIKVITIEGISNEIIRNDRISNSEYNQFTQLLNTSLCE